MRASVYPFSAKDSIKQDKNCKYIQDKSNIFIDAKSGVSGAEKN